MEELMDLWKRFLLIVGISLTIFGGLLLAITAITARGLGEWTPNLMFTAIKEGGIMIFGLTFVVLFTAEKISNRLAGR